ncbi:hypothetical protein P43SY_002843 [Pythium insidiosum]|uniref:Arrestin C-terminal-like domain-containing protein n=1 Tax=Pythium insidiosum TaxID=114742 RepID=A0AAD5MB92_PYTIN|nr:hypothetical protein P43SY_002843 [Pythium insidiosum]
MLNNFTKHDDIRVVLDTKHVRPGDQVIGRVVLRGEARRRPELELTLSGEERISWDNWLGVVNPKYRTHAVFRPVTILVSNPAAIDLASATTLSTYTSVDVPFSIQLPNDIPGSFCHHMPIVEFGSEVDVSIVYRVSARVLGLELMTDSEAFDVAWASMPSVALPPPLGDLLDDAKLDQLAISERLKSFGIFPRGEISISGSLPQTAVATTSKVAMQLQIDNQRSKMDVKKIQLALYAFATIRLHHSVDDTKVYHAPQLMHQREFPGVARGDKVDRLLSMPLTPNDETQNRSPTPTMSSHFLTLTYLLAAECKMRHGATRRVHTPIVLTPSTIESDGQQGSDNQDRNGGGIDINDLVSVLLPDN